MKIAFVLSSFPVISETFIVNQICALLDKGHEVEILTFKKNEGEIIHQPILDYNLLDKVNLWQTEPKSKWKRINYLLTVIFRQPKKYNFSKILTTLNFLKYGKKALSLHYFYKSQWFLRKDYYDVIHCHFAQSGLFVAKLKSMGFLNCERLVVSFHGTDIDPGRVETYKKKYAILFENFDLFTYNSEYTLAILKQVISDTGRMRLLPVGLDTGKFSRTGDRISSRNVQILYCGRLVPFKGPDIAIEIIHKLIQRGHEISFTIIGKGDLMDDIKRSIQVYGLHNIVNLKGAMSQERIIETMDASDIFLLPGIHDSITGRAENQGLVIQEAQAMQLPVVVSDAGGMKYGLIDGETGFVVEEKNIESFVEKLELLINDSSLRRAMGKEGREFVVQNFDSKILCEKLISYYSEELR